MNSLTGAERIALERTRQIEEEGWDAEHDRGHGDSLALAAACYAIPPTRRWWNLKIGPLSIELNLQKTLWVWEPRWWKPSPEDRIRELEKAGALCAAAIDAHLETL